MTPPIYIITLASATQRRAFQQAQADRLGFEPIWHPAVGVDDMSDAFFLQHAFSWQRPLKRTEVGCFMSHYQLWQRIAQSDRPAVVLEDDVILAPQWLQTLEQLVQCPDADLVNLEAVGKKQIGPANPCGSLQLHRLSLNSSGAGAYLLWPQGAKKLVDRFQRQGAALADVFINEARSLKAWQLKPAVVIQQCMLPYYGLPAMEEGVSQIARESHASPVPPSLAVVWGMKWRRLKGEWRKGLIKMQVLLGHRRQFVPYLNHERHR
jgi:glycosyl transferase, family 25